MGNKPMTATKTIGTDVQILTVRELLDMLPSINTAPTYQRGEVWEDADKISVLQSLLKFECPAMTFRKLEDGTFEVIDGKQRLSLLSELESCTTLGKQCFTLTTSDGSTHTIAKATQLSKYPEAVREELYNVRVPIVIKYGLTNDQVPDLFIDLNSSKNVCTAEKLFAPDSTLKFECGRLAKLPFWSVCNFRTKRLDIEHLIAKILYTEVEGIQAKTISTKVMDAFRETFGMNPQTMATIGSVHQVITLMGKIFIREEDFKIQKGDILNIYFAIKRVKEIVDLSDVDQKINVRKWLVENIRKFDDELKDFSIGTTPSQEGNKPLFRIEYINKRVDERFKVRTAA